MESEKGMKEKKDHPFIGDAYFGDCVICGERIKAGDGLLFFAVWVGRLSGGCDYTGRVPVHQECFYDALRHYRKEKENA